MNEKNSSAACSTWGRSDTTSQSADKSSRSLGGADEVSSNSLSSKNSKKPTEVLTRVAVRFAGDSGDGMQLTGARFTAESARLGNDLATLPDFPAEIRAPAGSIPGVSAFQIQIGSVEIYTAGDRVDALIAMNPAALKSNLDLLKQNGILIVNADAFSSKNLTRVGYDSNPLDDPELESKYSFISAPITSLTHEAVSKLELSKRESDKCRNFFALGIVCWLYERSIQETRGWLERKFGKDSLLADANGRALEAGFAFAEASEIFRRSFTVQPAPLESGTYRNITGNMGLAYGLLAAGELSGLDLFYAGYPITPASDILHEMSRHKDLGVTTFQAEDEIAACCAAIGASYAGKLGITCSSGPGIALKQEAIGLAVVTELPLVIVNVQRAGPSTGLPTKTEQADLLEVLFGRNGECPVVVVAAASPADAFETAIEACRLAVEHMVPVFLLSEGSIGVGSQPWKIPNISEIPKIKTQFTPENAENFLAFERDPNTHVRNWPLPGTKGLEHRIGGLEKDIKFGNVSYNPENHHKMVQLRAAKVARVADRLPASEVFGPAEGDLLVLSWGGTFGSVRAAAEHFQSTNTKAKSVSHLHLRYLNPLPADLEQIFKRFKRILVPELNLGQLRMLLRAQFLLDIQGYNRVTGTPFQVDELITVIEKELSHDS